MEVLGQHRRLVLDWRVLTVAKDADYPEENQDAVRVDVDRGTAAIADGVTSSLFARLWATILVEATTNTLPDPDDREAQGRWLAEHRAAWSRQIDVSRLAWFQKAKLRDGAFSTLLAVRLVPPEEAAGQDEPTWRLRGVAIGDSCLFHVRNGQLLRKFPIQSSAELESDPMVLGSVDLNRDERISFHRLDEPCLPGDLVVLCTDALADWALRREESGDPPAWEIYWEMDATAWTEGILSLRTEREIRCDDTTLLLLRIVDGAERGEESNAEPVPPELPSDVPPVPPPVSPADDWIRKIRAISEQAAEGLAQGLSRSVERLKKARQAAQSKLKDYLDRLREDDR